MRADPRTIHRMLLTGGLTHAQACGVIGNIQQESQFETTALGFDKTGSYGLCQWLGPRKAALFRFATQAQVSPIEPSIQIRFLLHELKTTERRAGELLRACVTPANAALVFSKHFERPHPKYAHNDKRVRYAERWARELQRPTEGA